MHKARNLWRWLKWLLIAILLILAGLWLPVMTCWAGMVWAG